MNRQHIHLAPALTGPITPRNNSTLLIFLDLPKLLAANIPVYAAANGVVLTPGDEHGIVGKEFWRKAVHVSKGQRRVVWEDGAAADRLEREGEA
jgi:2'-phosphotransferase